MAKFAKGKSGNPSGRPVGSKTLKTKQWEELGHALMTTHSEKANKILKDLEGKDFLDQYFKLAEYFAPKLSRTEVKQTGTMKINVRKPDSNI